MWAHSDPDLFNFDHRKLINFCESKADWWSKGNIQGLTAWKHNASGWNHGWCGGMKLQTIFTENIKS